MPFIDTHLHLDLLADSTRLIDEARGLKIGGWVVPGTTITRWGRLMTTVESCPGAYAAPGVHPAAAGQWMQSNLEELRLLLHHPRTIAIGEVGLDRQAETPWPTQERIFVEMIRLGLELKLPLLLHSRGATARLLQLLRQEGADQVGGIWHAFSGSLETAKQAIDLGFAIGVGGVVTYTEARRLPEIVRQLPDEMLVLETDAPDLAPHPHRGETNRPAHLVLVAEAVAALRGWSLAQTRQVTAENSGRILGLNPVTMAKNRRTDR